MKLRPLALLPLACALLATQPNEATRRWWAHVTAMGGDALQGRDTGSEGYRQAARYVVEQFRLNGLQPAGESGYSQPVPLHEVRLLTDRSSIEIVHSSAATPLHWLRQVTVLPRAGIPSRIDAPLVFAGADASSFAGKIAVQLVPPMGTRGPAPPAGIAALLQIDTPGGPEPPRWPAAYAVSMTLRGAAPAASAGPPVFRLHYTDAAPLFAASGHTYQELLALRSAGKPLPTFPLHANLRVRMEFAARDLESDNIIASLPGSDPALRDQYIVVSAHLDGYGIGEPRNGDRIYNGAFDDEAYVATLIDFAERLRQSHARLKRSLLFCVFTGEEKGLLGSKYFTAHPTVPPARLAADINLDQLRPIFPLRILTMLALDESTLGDTVRRIAAPMGIRIQPDPEPERNLLRRSDHFSFMQIGVPATGFVFGYEKGSPEEAVYRRWYADRYHSPADDLDQPWDPAAAAKFNDFFARLAIDLANAADRPHWKPGSPYAK